MFEFFELTVLNGFSQIKLSTTQPIGSCSLESLSVEFLFSLFLHFIISDTSLRGSILVLSFDDTNVGAHRICHSRHSRPPWPLARSSMIGTGTARRVVAALQPQLRGHRNLIIAIFFLAQELDVNLDRTMPVSF